MRGKILYVIIIILILAGLLVSPVYGLPWARLLTMSGAVSMSDSLTSGSFSSGGFSAGSVEYSSDTLIMTGGTPRPTQVPSRQGSAGQGVGDTIFPPWWVKSNTPGIFVDPETSTSWIYNPVFQTYFSPVKGWFLIVQKKPDNSVAGFLYYDYKARKLFDAKTGEVVSGGSEGGTGSVPAGISTSGSEGRSLPTQKPTQKPDQTITPDSGHIIAGEDVTGGSCEVACAVCPSGICHDCNTNGICDEYETSSDDGQSEEAQPPAQRTPAPTPTGEISEEPQESIQINLPLPMGDTGEYTQETEGGESEEAQGSVLYMLLKGKGPFEVLACPSSGTCVYCIDENKDGDCSDTDCYLIRCPDKKICSYCLDCNRDGLCDTGKKILANCSEGKTCVSFDYCDDMDHDGSCDQIQQDFTQNVSDISPVKIKGEILQGGRIL
ncbi:MAG: hypothetical protein LUQ07_00870 [Methanospirillum sp.]|nr:hypothetical protein [Methanospirillum sp.]